MKKVINCFTLICLSGCANYSGDFLAYDGYKTITGEGGFIDARVYKSELLTENLEPMPVFAEYVETKDAELTVSDALKATKYDVVTFYQSGLPDDKHCIYVGYYSGPTAGYITDYYRFAQSILILGANVATKSPVSFPVRFDGGNGILGVERVASDWYNGYGIKTDTGYNIFECLDN